MLLESAFRELSIVPDDSIKLEPLFPGSLTLRQARLKKPSADEDLHTTSISNLSLLSEPHAWYVAHRAVPDHYLNRVRSKHPPYIIIFCNLNYEFGQVRSLLEGITTSQCNIFLITTENSGQHTQGSLGHDLTKNIDRISDLYLFSIKNISDKLSLIKHAQHVITDSIGEVADAFTLGVPCSWIKSKSKNNTNSHPTENPTETVNITRDVLTKFATERLNDHLLINTYCDLANAMSVKPQHEIASNQPVLKTPIMALSLPEMTITQKQKRELTKAMLLRKSRKFRESPKRFFSDMRWFR